MIRRLITLILDEAAARKLEKEMEDALDRGTKQGARKGEQNLSVVERAMGKIRSVAGQLVGMFAAAFGARAIVRFGQASVHAAMESQERWGRLAGQLAATGTEFAAIEDQVRGVAEEMQRSTKFGDEEFADALTEMVGITGKYTTSLEAMQLTADLAAAKNMSLVDAARLVGRVMVGETDMLKRYGIVVKDGANAMDLLRDRFAGMAEVEGATLSGRLEILKNGWGEFQEAVGNALIAAGGGTSVLDTLIATVRAMTTWVTENQNKIAGWGIVVIRTFRAAFETVRFVARTIINAFDIVGSTLASLFLHITEHFARMVNSILGGIDMIPLVNIEFRMNEMTPEEYAAAQQRIFEDIKGDAGDLADGLGDLANAYRDVGVAAVEAATGQAQVASIEPPAPRVSAPDDSIDNQSLAWQVKQRMARIAFARAAVEEFREGELEKLREDATAVADEIGGGFDAAFSTIASGFQAQEGVFATAAQAAREAGAGIVAGLVAGRAEEQVAAGTAALASGTWPPNPAAIAAAFKHFAAAALYRAIPGIVRGGGGGGGGSVGSIPRGAIGSSLPGTQQLPGAEVHIYIDPLSPSDARAQQFVAGAMQNATERYGSNVRLHVHPAVG